MPHPQKQAQYTKMLHRGCRRRDVDAPLLHKLRIVPRASLGSRRSALITNPYSFGKYPANIVIYPLAPPTAQGCVEMMTDQGLRGTLQGDSRRWIRMAAVASVIWIISGGYAGVHVPVGPAISSYEKCVRQSDSPVCDQTFRQQWALHSRERVHYGALFAFAPLPLIWMIAFCLRKNRGGNSRF